MLTICKIAPINFKFYLFSDDTNLLYTDRKLKSFETVVNCELLSVYLVNCKQIIVQHWKMQLAFAKFTTKFVPGERKIHEYPGQPRGGGRGFKWLPWCSDLFFKSCKNDRRNSDLFFKVMRKRETKFKSAFKVMRKRRTKNEIHIRFSKWCEN